MMYVIGEAREALGENPTDAGIAAAYNPFVANSGRYTVPGNEVTYQAFVAKDPAYISEFEPTGGEGNAQALTFNIDDGTLTLSFGEGGRCKERRLPCAGRAEAPSTKSRMPRAADLPRWSTHPLSSRQATRVFRVPLGLP